jgi:hypothetical protein
MTKNAIEKKDHLYKLNHNALIGYLVANESTNIYRVWNLKTNKGIRVYDVTFNEDEV